MLIPLIPIHKNQIYSKEVSIDVRPWKTNSLSGQLHAWGILSSYNNGFQLLMFTKSSGWGPMLLFYDRIAWGHSTDMFNLNLKFVCNITLLKPFSCSKL